MADLSKIYIKVPKDINNPNHVVVNCNEASDYQFNWWIQSWIDKGAFIVEYNPEKGTNWTRKERMDIIDWMRDVGITIHES